MNRLICVALGGALLLGISVAQTKSNQNLNKLKGSLNSIHAKRSTLAKKLRDTKKKVRIVKGDIVQLDQQMTHLEAELEHTTSRLERAKVQQQLVQLELRRATERLAQTQIQVRSRLRWMYVHGEASITDALLTSKSLGDFSSRTFLLSEIAQADRSLFESHKENQTIVANRKKQADEVLQEITRLRNRQDSQKIGLANVREDKAFVLGKLRSQQRGLERLVRELDAEEASIQAKIRAYLRSTGSKSPLPRFSGKMGKPTAGRISSGYGMRFHPILHRNRMHTGIDFAGGRGAPIYAAADGIVIAATTYRGYGHTVLIDHGGGVSTLYGHCSAFSVRSGQKVKRGQRVASIGSTGLATGPHLHFEVRINGSPRNPSGWIR